MQFFVIRGIVVICLLTFAAFFAVKAQSPIKAFPPGTFSNKAAFDPVAVSYQGPGDIVSGAIGFWSCARAYDLAHASTSTSLCDLVDKTTGAVAICTLRATTSGSVDLTGTYCTGSTTPSVACAAAAGGACNISKAYDQTGTGNDMAIATNSQRPILTFSALNSCPGMTGIASNGTRLITGSTVTATQPFTMTGLGIRTANFTTLQGLIGGQGVTIDLTYRNATNSAQMGAGSTINATASNSAFHAMVGVYNNASSSLVIDGSATTGTTGTNAFSSSIARLMRDSSGGSLDGTLIEAGIWPSGFNSTQYGNMNTNMHSSTVGCGSF